MNRLVALVAVSSLGTGCVSSSRCDFRTFTIEWPMFELAGGSVVTSCADAGARTVNVYGDGGLVTSSACTDGLVDIDVPAGDHQVVVEALDASGTRIILRDEFLTGGRGCGPEDVVVEPAAGNFLLDYSFTPVNVCTAGLVHLVQGLGPDRERDGGGGRRVEREPTALRLRRRGEPLAPQGALHAPSDRGGLRERRHVLCGRDELHPGRLLHRRGRADHGFALALGLFDVLPVGTGEVG